MAKNIYKVTVLEGNKAVEVALVRAATKITACAYVFNRSINAAKATAEDIVQLMSEGVTVEDATSEEPAAPATPESPSNPSVPAAVPGEESEAKAA